MTSIYTGIVGPNTVLAQALFTSQEALAEVTDETILGDLAEASNFATALGVFATYIPIRDMKSSFKGEEIRNRLLERISLLRWLSVRNPGAPAVVRDVQKLKTILVQEIPESFYISIVKQAIDSAMAVFG